jgi:hypothetical protein
MHIKSTNIGCMMHPMEMEGSNTNTLYILGSIEVSIHMMPYSRVQAIDEETHWC